MCIYISISKYTYIYIYIYIYKCIYICTLHTPQNACRYCAINLTIHVQRTGADDCRPVCARGGGPHRALRPRLQDGHRRAVSGHQFRSRTRPQYICIQAPKVGIYPLNPKPEILNKPLITDQFLNHRALRPRLQDGHRGTLPRYQFRSRTRPQPTPETINHKP